jgi:D-xylose transport system permease protein
VTDPRSSRPKQRATEIPPQEAPESLRGLLSRYSIQRWRQGEIGSLPVVLGLILIAGFFASQERTFLSARNISNLIVQIAATGSVAVGIVMVLLLGEIDLSVGSVTGLCSALLGVLIVNHGWPWWLAILAVMATGALIGAFQGAWFAFIGVPSFVVTLAGFLAWQGVQLRVLGSTGTVNVFEPHIGKIAQSFLPGPWGWVVGLGAAAVLMIAFWGTWLGRRRTGLLAVPMFVVLTRTLLVVVISVAIVLILSRFNGVPTAGVILFALVAVFSFLTMRTRFGRYVFAVGGSAEAARRAGISVARVRIAVFTLAGLMASIGGIVFVSRLTAASTQTGTGTFLLEAIAAAVIGGTSLFGGRGSVWSALLGALVIGSVSNGLDLMAQPPEIKYMVEGAILLVAVTVDAVARRSRAAAGR